MSAGECAALVTEEQRFQHCVRHRRAIDRYEGIAVAGRGLVKEARQNLLARPCGTNQHNRHIAGGHPFGEAQEVEGRGVASSGALVLIKETCYHFSGESPVVVCRADMKGASIEFALQ